MIDVAYAIQNVLMQNVLTEYHLPKIIKIRASEITSLASNSILNISECSQSTSFLLTHTKCTCCRTFILK